jgi:hypothetical protein
MVKSPAAETWIAATWPMPAVMRSSMSAAALMASM